MRGRCINGPNINEDASIFRKNDFQAAFKNIKKGLRNRKISNSLAPQTGPEERFTVITSKLRCDFKFFSSIAMREPPCVDSASFDMKQLFTLVLVYHKVVQKVLSE